MKCLLLPQAKFLPVPACPEHREKSGKIGTIVQCKPQPHSGDILVARMVAELVEVKPGVGNAIAFNSDTVTHTQLQTPFWPKRGNPYSWRAL